MRKQRYVLVCGWTVVGSLAVMLAASAARGQCEVQQLTSPAGEKGNLFAGVSICRDVAAVADVLAFSSLGAVYVFRRGPDGPGDWEFEAVLRSPEPDPEEAFGRVAISGDVVVVGAHNAAAPEFHSGAAYIFRYDGADWNFEAKLTASDGDFNDIFGFSVAIDGDVVLIGARDDENDGVPQSGSAYVFRYNPDGSGQWVEEAKLTHPDAQELDAFGFSVSIRGNLALIGAGTDAGRGSAFVFRYDGEDWLFEAELTAFDGEADDRFGSSVSLRGDIAVAGAPQNDGQTGAAYIFQFDGTNWAHEIKLTASDPVGPWPSFGRSLSMSSDGSNILVGAPFDFALGFESGAAHLFRDDGTGWKEVIKLTASDGDASDFFGVSVAVSGDTALVGAPRPSEQPGTVYVFDLDSIPGDLDCDGTVGMIDLLMLLAAWGPCDGPCPPPCAGDLDGNCTVNVLDLLTLLTHWS